MVKRHKQKREAKEKAREVNQGLSFRKYGSSSISVVLLDGGPGAIGEMEPVAKRLSSFHGILEHFQITALHGEWDPHPIGGAFDSLTRFIPHFRGIVLKECGHTPWIERRARDQFFDLLQKELQS